MAVIKAANSKIGGNLKKLISYVTKEEKTEDKYISGLNCNPETALEEMQTTKQQFDKLEGREYKHFVQSFKPNEVTAEKAHEIAKEWAEKHFKGYEVLIATHEDKKHIHTHFVVNSVSFEDGRKYQQSKNDLKEMKLSSDRICEREGLSIITEKSKEITAFNQKKYKAIERAFEGNYKSYVVNTALAVNKAIKSSMSREEFIKNMENQGYSVKWIDTNKNVTFTNSEGEKVRLSNLQKTFKNEIYSKEGLENEFRRTRGKEYDTGERHPIAKPGGSTRTPTISRMDDYFGKYPINSRGYEETQSRSDKDIRQADNNRGFNGEALKENGRDLNQLSERSGDIKGSYNKVDERVYSSSKEYQPTIKGEPSPTVSSITEINRAGKQFIEQPEQALSRIGEFSLQNHEQDGGREAINPRQIETDRSNSSFEHIGCNNNDINNTTINQQCNISQDLTAGSIESVSSVPSKKIDLNFADIALKAAMKGLDTIGKPIPDHEQVKQIKQQITSARDKTQDRGYEREL